MNLKTVIQTLVGIVMVLTLAPAYSQTLLFNDNISGYTVGSSYTSQNPAVQSYQYSNDPPYATNPLIQTSAGATTGGPINATPPGQFAVLDTSQAAGINATTGLNVPLAAPSTDQYGQAFILLTKTALAGQTSNTYISLSSSQVSDQVNTYVGSGPFVGFLAGGSLEYYNGSSQVYPTTYAWGSPLGLTINYDLTAKTYDVWLGTTEIVSGAGFSTGYGFTPGSLSSLNIYENLYQYSQTALSSWNWQTSSSTPFTSYGAPILPVPEPGAAALILFSVGALAFAARRRKTAKA